MAIHCIVPGMPLHFKLLNNFEKKQGGIFPSMETGFIEDSCSFNFLGDLGSHKSLRRDK